MISDNEKGNRYHVPAGSSKGGQFASKNEMGGDTPQVNDLSDFAKYQESLKTALKGVINKLESFRGKSDGTYDFVTGEPVDLSDGYMVTFHQNEADENGHYKSHFGRYTSEEYDRRSLEFAQANNARVYIGVFDDEPEISFKVDSLEEAIRLMKEYKQKSIWNNAAGKAIPNEDYEKVKSENPMQGD